MHVYSDIWVSNTAGVFLSFGCQTLTLVTRIVSSTTARRIAADATRAGCAAAAACTRNAHRARVRSAPMRARGRSVACRPVIMARHALVGRRTLAHNTPPNDPTGGGIRRPRFVSLCQCRIAKRFATSTS